MNNQHDKVHILIIDDDFEEAADIKLWLDKDMRVPWNGIHCISFKEAMPRINNVNLIILKPEMKGLSTPMQIFEDIEDMVFEVPIIVLANTDDEHGLSTFVMEKGAADTVIRGKFDRLVDAIEFALIRQKIATDTRKASDQNLQNSKDQAAATLQENQDKREKDQEESKNMLSMFMGDYSATNNHTKK